jgi:hypothetical protein
MLVCKYCGQSYPALINDCCTYCLRCFTLRQEIFGGLSGQPLKKISEVEMTIEGAKHFDEGKEPLDQLPTESLMEIAKVMAMGEKKYGRNNWTKGMDWHKLIGSTLRHVMKFNMGEDIDKESGLSHLAHAACDIMFLQWYVINKKGTDTRYKEGK